MNHKIYRNITWLLLILFVFIIVLAGSYMGWNAANPQKTCASCHEISPAHSSWAESAHSEILCSKCHGTALGNGWHSLREKTGMVFTHVKNTPRHDDIRLTEDQLIETMQRCKSCHSTEFANWLSGGHSANYEHIFLHETHDTTEQLNFDCLRCHGMFYAGTINDLVEPLSVEGPWKMKDSTRTGLPTIPCMACHQIHAPGFPSVRPDYANPNLIFYGRVVQNNSVALYSRHEKTHFNLANLPTPVMLNNTDTVKTPVDFVYRLCVQCHASGVWHQAGQGDDRTPTGVHEGLSCRACHEPHSNYQRNSCNKCHPAISNCKLDVKTMNTTFFDPGSTNDIHHVACTDCHKDEKHKIRGR